jgi:hypothetical protein
MIANDLIIVGGDMKEWTGFLRETSLGDASNGGRGQGMAESGNFSVLSDNGACKQIRAWWRWLTLGEVQVSDCPHSVKVSSRIFLRSPGFRREIVI